MVPFQIDRGISGAIQIPVHDPSAQHRHQHLRAADAVGGHPEEIAVENDQIGQLAPLERARAAVLVHLQGAAHRVGPNRLGERDALDRVERPLGVAVPGIGPARDAALDCIPGKQRVHGPVARGGQACAASNEAAGRVEPAEALGPQVGPDCFDREAVALKPLHLHVRDHLEGGKARNVGGVDELEMGDGVAGPQPVMWLARRDASNAFSAARTARSPIACACTCQPARLSAVVRRSKGVGRTSSTRASCSAPTAASSWCPRCAGRA